MPLDENRGQQTPPDVLKQHLSVSFGVCGCLFVSGFVWCCLLASPAPWRCVGVCGGWLVGVWGYLSDIHGKLRHSDVFGGIWILSPCSTEPHHYFGTTLKGTTFFHLTIMRYQIIKMSICKLNKNGWVLPFLCFLVPVRKIWKKTVAVDHPVPTFGPTLTNMTRARSKSLTTSWNLQLVTTC